MKKLVRLFSVLALASTVAFTSCTGDTGPQGVPGPQGTPGTNGQDGADGSDGADGKDGNANVQGFRHTVGVSDWVTTEVPGIGSGSTSTWGTVAIMNELITADSYVKGWVVNGDFEYELPISLSKEIDGSVESLQISKGTGQVNLYYKSQSQLFGGSKSYKPATDLVFKFVVIEESELAAMKAAGVDLSDYVQVVNYLNRTVTVPTQL